MRHTENLRLKLPGPEDPVEVKDLTDNFEKLDKPVSSFMVGDILATYRNNPGDDWLLCNGDTFDPDEYPKLAEICPPVSTLAELGSTMTIPSKAEYLNENYTLTGNILDMVVVPNSNIINIIRQYSTGNVYPRAPFYTTDNFKTLIYVSNYPFGYENPLLKMFYVNGYWIYISGTTSKWAHIYSGVQVNGTLTDNASPPTGLAIPSHIEYYNGKYYMFTTKTNGTVPVVISSTTPRFTNPTEYIVPYTNRVTSTVWYFVRTKGYFGWIGTLSNKFKDILYSTEPVSGWAEHTGYSASFECAPTYLGPQVVNDVVVFSGNVSNDNTNKILTISLRYIKDLGTGTINTKTITEVNGVSAHSSNGNGLTSLYWENLKAEFLNGYYVFFGGKSSNANIFAFKDFSNSSPVFWVWSNGKTSTYPFNFCDTGISNMYLAKTLGVIKRKDAVWVPSGNGIFAKIPIAAVPLINPPQSNAFIKAK